MKRFYTTPTQLQQQSIAGCDQSGNWDLKKVAVPGTRILASDRNAEFMNVIANSNPAGLSSAASDIPSLQNMLNPYVDPNPVIPDSLCEEIREIRYQLAAISGEDYWYLPPITNIQALNALSEGNVTGGDNHNHLGTTIDQDNGGGALITAGALDSGCVTNSKLDDLAVDTRVLDNASVTHSKMAPLAVDTANIIDEAITYPKLDPSISFGQAKQIQYNVSSTAFANLSSHFDGNMPPLISGGTEIITLSITPKTIGNILVIDSFFNYDLYRISAAIPSTNGNLFLALFDNSISTSIQYGHITYTDWPQNEYYSGSYNLKFIVQVSSLNQIIFSIRAGLFDASQSIYYEFSINNIAGSSSILNITEYTP